MAVAENTDLRNYCLEMAARARRASVELSRLSGGQKNAWLKRSAELMRSDQASLQQANAVDLAEAPKYGLTPAEIDRLRLTPAVIESMAVGLEEVAALPEPIGEVIESSIRPNGLEVLKVRVPLGVVFFIYESRPNVTADAAAICVKSGNAVILRGGKEAPHSNRAIVACSSKRPTKSGMPFGGGAIGWHDRPRGRRPFSRHWTSTSTWRFRAAARA